MKRLFEILYPPLCLHCGLPLEDTRNLLCTLCLEDLVPLEIKGRCRTCFSEETPCTRCIAKPSCIKRRAAACSSAGAASTLAKHLQRGNTRFVPEIAALLTMQLHALDWPLPDLVMPLPCTLWMRCIRGKNPSIPLAHATAHLLQKPATSNLKKISDKRILLVTLEFYDNNNVGELLLQHAAQEIYALSFLETNIDN